MGLAPRFSESGFLEPGTMSYDLDGCAGRRLCAHAQAVPVHGNLDDDRGEGAAPGEIPALHELACNIMPAAVAHTGIQTLGQCPACKAR